MTTEISSFAVLDLETTTLPDFNFNKANITEISIHGFNAEDVSKAINCKSPRINHKLTLLFNPLMVIEPKTEEITGLNNYILESESKFDNNAANLIINFLKHLRQPVCLVAHNGNNFDFPVLKHAFSKLGSEIPMGTLCLDSLVAFKDLDLAEESDTEFAIPLVSDPIVGIEEFVTPLKDDNTNAQVENETNSNLSKIKIESDIPNNSTDIPEENESIVDWQKFNETTPKRPPNVDNIRRKKKRQLEEESPSTTTEPSSRKSLQFGSTPAKTLRYNLGSIYERVFGNPSDIAHHAEADVISLEKIILKYGKSFVDYAIKNAKPFSEVKKLGAR